MYSKWKHNYIDNVNLNKIDWIVVNSKELNEFFENNYFDDEEYRYITNEDTSFTDVPFGLHYLSYDYYNNDYKYLLGLVNNNIGKKTIVAAIMYLDNYFVYSNQRIPVTFLSSAEVNIYFRNRGLYRKLCEKFIEVINHNQHLITSKESEMGELCKTFNILKEVAVNKNFMKEILVDTGFYENREYMYNLLCGEQKTLKKVMNEDIY